VTTVVDRSVEGGRSYLYRIVVTMGGKQVAFAPIVAKAGERVTEFALARIAPNPMAASTRIDYTVARESKVRLTIVDLQGRTVAVLRDGIEQPGRHQLQWDGASGRGVAAAGVYFVRYEAAGKSSFKRLLIAR